jgi:peptidoglycan/xylan/chitin deacetylase (PgdA/CDA1 family)
LGEDELRRWAGWKSVGRRAAYQALRASGWLALRRARRTAAGAGWCSVLVFHRVTSTAPEDGITMSPPRFRRVLRMLRDRYTVITASDLISRLSGGAPLTGREVVISFDDGYLDNYEIAAPLLEEFGLPAIFFLTAGYVGTAKPFPWDDAKRISAPLMTWTQAAELIGRGHEIGCHTWSHPDLGVTPVDRWQAELLDARAFMENKLSTRVAHFAYPFGGRNNITADWVAAAERAGFASLFCGFGGLATGRDSPFWIPRMGASHQRTLSELRIEMDDAW